MDQDIDFNRFRLSWGDAIQVGDLTVEVDAIIEKLAQHLTSERIQRIDSVVAGRSLHVLPVLENIYDRGNVSAVMRSSESFGLLGMTLIDREGARFKAANRVTRGAEKWLDVRSFKSAEVACQNLREQGYQIWATDLDTTNTISSLDWSRPIAIVLGNEKDGVSPELKALSDGTFRIPMVGFSQSFNISVAAALIFYHAHLEMKKLGDQALLSPHQRRQVLANYYLRCFDNPEALLRAKM